MRGDMGELADILMDDLEGLLREINEFTTGNNRTEEIPLSLERYLQFVAKSGNIVFPWHHVRLVFRNKILQAMEQFPGEMCPVGEAFVMERFDLFRAAPFTIQRLAELITQPTRHYKKKEKFLRGLEKTVLVVSTIEPWSLDADMKNGNDSGSDGETDQNYSENEENPPRPFIVEHHNVMMASMELPPITNTEVSPETAALLSESSTSNIVGETVQNYSDESLPRPFVVEDQNIMMASMELPPITEANPSETSTLLLESSTSNIIGETGQNYPDENLPRPFVAEDQDQNIMMASMELPPITEPNPVSETTQLSENSTSNIGGETDPNYCQENPPRPSFVAEDQNIMMASMELPPITEANPESETTPLAENSTSNIGS